MLITGGSQYHHNINLEPITTGSVDSEPMLTGSVDSELITIWLCRQ